MTRRDGAVSMAMRRKEEYLGARVPKELRDRVVEKAREMAIPVSILMRNILEDAFNYGVYADNKNASSAPRADTDLVVGKFETVLGWGRIVLNKSVSCTGCGVELCAGKGVALGLGAAHPVILCYTCKSCI